MPKIFFWKLLVVIVVFCTTMTVSAKAAKPEKETSLADELVAYATSEEFLGLPYLWGGTSPETGFDCSGFVQYVYANFGVDIPRTTWEQCTKGSPVYSIGELEKGDLLFFYSYGHVGIYVGEGRFVHSCDSGLIISSIEEGGYWATEFCGGSRILQEE